jgi:hypothetical protein
MGQLGILAGNEKRGRNSGVTIVLCGYGTGRDRGTIVQNYDSGECKLVTEESELPYRSQNVNYEGHLKKD